MGREQTVLKVGIVAMYVAVAFTFASAAVIVALRGEPTRALASERTVLAAEEGPAHPPKPLPEPERPKLEPEPVRQKAEPSQPTPARAPRPQPKPQTQPGPKPEQKAKAEPRAQLQARPKPEPERAPKPRPKPEPDRSAGRSPEPGPAREAVQRAEPQRAEPQRAESQRSERRAKPERSRPAAEKPRRSVLPAGVTMALSINALGLRDVPVRTSASGRALDNGVIHLPDTSLPWDDGPGGRNVYLAGHRLGYPGTGSHRIFYRLGELRKGDAIVIKDRLGRRYEYRVTGSRVVAPSDSWVKHRVPGRDMLSLQTCTPIPTFERRLIVRANRV